MLLFIVRVYRALLSPALTTLLGPLGFGCRFYPTCSQYAAQAIQDRGAIKGSALATRRLCRCHPWGGSGNDPVPPAKSKAQSPLPSAQDADSIIVRRSDLLAHNKTTSLGTASGPSS